VLEKGFQVSIRFDDLSIFKKYNIDSFLARDAEILKLLRDNFGDSEEEGLKILA
jgi:hypothetical protein